MFKKISLILFGFLFCATSAFATVTILDTTFSNDRDIDKVWIKDKQHADLYTVDNTGLIIDASGLSTLPTPSGSLMCTVYSKSYGALPSSTTVYYKYAWITYGGQESLPSPEYSCVTGGGNTIQLSNLTWPSNTDVAGAAIYTTDSTGGSPHAYNLTQVVHRTNTTVQFISHEAGGSWASPEDPVYGPRSTAEGDSLTAVMANEVVKDGIVDIKFKVATTTKDVEFSVREAIVHAEDEDSRYLSGIRVSCTSGTGCDLTEVVENVTKYNPASCTDSDCAAYDDGAEHTIRFDFNAKVLSVYIDNMTTAKWTTTGLQTQTATNRTGYITMTAKAVKLTIPQVIVKEYDANWTDAFEYWNCNQRPTHFTYHGIETDVISEIPLNIFQQDLELAKSRGFNPVTRTDVENWMSDCTTNFLPENPFLVGFADAGSANALTKVLPTLASVGLYGTIGSDPYRLDGVTEISPANFQKWLNAGMGIHLDVEINSEAVVAAGEGDMCNSYNFTNTEMKEDIHDFFFKFGGDFQDPYGHPFYAKSGVVNCARTRPGTIDQWTSVSGISFLELGIGSPPGGFNYYKEYKDKFNRRNVSDYYSATVLDVSLDVEKYRTVERLTGDYRFQSFDLAEYINDTANRTDTHLDFMNGKISLDKQYTQKVAMDLRPDNSVYGWTEKIASPAAGVETAVVSGVLKVKTNGLGTDPYQYWGKDLIADLVSYWKLEETSGTRYDATSNHNNLTDNNTVLYAAGKFGNGADFEETNSEYLSIVDADQQGLDGMAKLSITAWIKPESIPSGETDIFLGKNNGVGNRSYNLNVQSGGVVRCGLSTTDNAWTVLDSTTALSAGSMYFVACVYDGTNMKVYVDAVLENTSGSITGTVSTSTAEFQIGDIQAGGYSADGVADDVGIWSKDLVQADLNTLYNSGTGKEINADNADGFIEAIAQVVKSPSDYSATPYIGFAGGARVDLAENEIKVYNGATLKDTYELLTTDRPHKYGLLVNNGNLDFYYDGAFIQRYTGGFTSASSMSFGVDNGAATQEVLFDEVNYSTATIPLRRHDYGILTTPVLLGNVDVFKALSWVDFENGTGKVYARVQSCDDAACVTSSGWKPSANRLVLDAMDSGWTASDGTNSPVTHPTSSPSPQEGTASMKLATTAGNSNNDYASKSITSKDLTSKDLLSFWVYSDTAGCDKFQVKIGESSNVATASETRTLCVDRALTWQKYYVDISRHISPALFDNFWPMEEINRRYDVGGAVDLEETGTVLQNTSGKIGNAAKFDNNTANYLSDTVASACSGASTCSWKADVNWTVTGVQDYIMSSSAIGIRTTTGNKAECEINQGGTPVTATSTTSFTGGTTYDVVICTYDKNAGSNQLKIYFNGTNEGNGTSTATLATATDLRIGQKSDGTLPLTGSVDEVVIDAETWDTETIAYIDNSGAGRDFRKNKGKMDLDAITHLFIQVVDDTGSPYLIVDDMAADRFYTNNAGSLLTGLGTAKNYYQFEFILTSPDQERSPSMWDHFNLLFKGSQFQITTGGGGGFDNGFN